MRRHSSFLMVVGAVLCAASVAAAHSVRMGGSPGLAVSGSTLTVATSTASAPPSAATGTETTTATNPTPTTTNPTPTTSSPTPATTTPAATVPPATTTGEAAIEQIVSITRVIDAGAPAVSAFTVPAGQRLVVTDVLITNPGPTAACGASITPGGAVPAAPATTGEAGTGLICVPAQSSLNLGLTTGLEFEGGQGLVLANSAATPLHYHLRGFLVVPGV